MKSAFITALVISWSFLAPLSISPVQAQTEVATDSANQENVVFSKPTLEAQIEDVKNTYRGQLETYRQAEKRYQVAKTQFQQLNTLASLEAAVKATHEAMIARDNVISTYLKLLRLLLTQANGINLDQKNPTLDKLEELSLAVENHATEVATANDRYALTTVADSFDTFSEEVQEVSYRTLSLLATGNLQTVYDQALSVSVEIGDVIASAGADLKQGERQRAYIEVQNQLTTVQQSFAAINLILKGDRGFNQRVYGDTLEELQTVYASLSQGLSFMSEILRL